MANISITFASSSVDSEMQVEDFIWYVSSIDDSENEIGKIISITKDILTETTTVVAEALPGVAPPSTSDFIFYIKSPIVSVGSLKGYFAESQFINDSTEYAELFSVGAEIFESSK